MSIGLEESMQLSTTVRSLERLEDSVLVVRLENLLKDDSLFEAELLATLGEVDHRRLYRERAFSSMFQFAVDALFLSESMAYKRITAARTAREYPLLLEKLARGELHLTGICLLAPHLTRENLEELAGAATHKSRRALEKLLADRFPKPEVPSRVRKLPNRALRATPPVVNSGTPDVTPQPAASAEPLALTGSRAARQLPVVIGDTEQTNCQTSLPSRQSSRRDEVAPLGADRYKIELTVDAAFCAKLQEARELLGFRVRKDDLAAVFSRALELLVDDLKNKKHGITSRPRKQRPHATPQQQKRSSRAIPRRVRREVFERDQGQCTYQDARGRRCEERSGLEYHHSVPYARGGLATVENIELRCRPHNALAAEQDYGAHRNARRGPDTVRESRARYRVGTESRASTGTGKSGFALWQSKESHHAYENDDSSLPTLRGPPVLEKSLFR